MLVSECCCFGFLHYILIDCWRVELEATHDRFYIQFMQNISEILLIKPYKLV